MEGSSKEEAKVVGGCHTRECNVKLLATEIAFFNWTLRHGNSDFAHGGTFTLVDGDDKGWLTWKDWVQLDTLLDSLLQHLEIHACEGKSNGNHD